MTSESQDSVLSSPERCGAVILAGTTFDEPQKDEFLYEIPNADEWRRVGVMLAEQLLLRMAGYNDKYEFISDGCRFMWRPLRLLGGMALQGRRRQQRAVPDLILNSRDSQAD
jgi:hypothetical protein